MPGSTPQGEHAARLDAASRSDAPGWVLAASAEAEAKDYLYGGYSPKQAKRVCLDCFMVKATGTGVCGCE